MRKFHKLILPLIVLILATSFSFAQEDGTKTKQKSSFDGYFYINGNIGATNFYGDMYQKQALVGDERFGYGFKAGYQFSPVFGFRGSFVNGKVQSTGDNSRDKNLNDLQDKFESSLWDISGQLTVDFTNIFRDNKDGWFGVYGFAGVGWLNYSSMRTNKDLGYITLTDGVENRSGSYSDTEGSGMAGAETAIVIPTGLGMYFNVSPKVAVNVESSLRFTNTDDMDMRQEGAMAVVNDFWGYTSLGVTYKFKPSSGLKQMKKNCAEVKYEVNPEVLEAHGDKVSFTIKITFPEKYFAKNSALKFTPYVKYGTETKALAPKFFKGEKLQGDGDVVPYATGGTYTYKADFDYTADMSNSQLMVLPLGFDPKDGVDAKMSDEDIRAKYKNLDMCETKLADGIRSTDDLAGGNEITATGAHGYELETIIAKTEVLYFPKNKANYSKRFGNNKSETAQANRQAVNDFLAQGWEIKDITVNAYASPEGEETFNANLSENRANTAKDYMHNELKKLIKAKDSKMGMEDCKGVTFNAVGNGPDWNGFMAALQASNIEDKNTMLNVIKSAAPEKKEEEIRNMILIYPELEDDILSPIRRAEVSANCFEPKRSAEEISQLATTDPKQLTTEELLYAATLTEDAKAKAAIYNSAAELHPDNWVAQNNAAVSAIQNRDFGAAISYLDKANSASPNNAEVINNYGVVYAKQGNWDKAAENFNNAKKLGANENYNLGVVALQNGEYESALNLFGNTKCDFNVALAQTLLEKYDEANNNLNCANANCKTNYLQAVIGARTGDTEQLYTHLQKAIEINPKFKGRAVTDREFVKYFNTEEFINIVK
ncbi:MAG: tetratricopeptide repeat protein [Bacteroidales bacterium]|nr:tetratricopeptide repeat protein [Bacteroidales bacterium]